MRSNEKWLAARKKRNWVVGKIKQTKNYKWLKIINGFSLKGILQRVFGRFLEKNEND